MVYYAVAKGVKPGIYNSWLECKDNVMCYGGAVFKKFNTKQEAMQFMNERSDMNYPMNNNTMRDFLVITSSESGEKDVDTTAETTESTTEPQPQIITTVPEIEINPTLTESQRKVIESFMNGENVFITGPGGCGKSFLIGEILKIGTELNKKITVTALTGCAAVLLGYNAKTLNSWGGVGLMNKSEDDIIKSVITNRKKRKNWTNCQVLIIDEVSMLSKRTFDILNTIGKITRNNDKPFGGIQLVLSGDFYQLPPVGDSFEGSNQFCFESEHWNDIFKNNQIILKKVFRQTDETYKRVLQQIRRGKITKESLDLLNSCINKVNDTDITPVRLYPKKYIVDELNESYNQKLDGKHMTYDVKIKTKNHDDEYTYIVKDEDKMKILSGASIKHNELLKLKVGSQVMCIVNYDMESSKKICNGSCGKVINISVNGNPIIKFHNGRILEMPTTTKKIEYEEKEYEVEFMPLILSWAMTIHKSQGASLDIAEIDIGSDIFECGQTYVALSRVRTLDGLYLRSFDVQKIKIKKVVKDFYENIKNK